LSNSELRFRQIHLDFHTSGHIPGIGLDFDPEEFAATLERARVDSVTCFARCHHGWIYLHRICRRGERRRALAQVPVQQGKVRGGCTPRQHLGRGRPTNRTPKLIPVPQRKLLGCVAVVLALVLAAISDYLVE
jgi:hypothetical protein